MTAAPPSVAEALLRALRTLGIDTVFANAGTDFAPVIEALCRIGGDTASIPRIVTVPHENLAVAMAHGHYLASGRPAAVMVHVNVVRYNTPDPARYGVEPPEEIIQRNAAIYRARLPNARVSVIARVGFDVAASCGTFFGPEGPATR